MALAKLIGLGLALVLGYGGASMIDQTAQKEFEIQVSTNQEFYNNESELIPSDYEPITQVYATKEVQEMTSEGKIVNYREYNDKSILIIDHEKSQYLFIPKQDESRQVASSNYDEILSIIDKYIEYYGIGDDYSQHDIDLEEYKKNHGHYDEIVGNDGCEACQEIYPN